MNLYVTLIMTVDVLFKVEILRIYIVYHCCKWRRLQFMSASSWKPLKTYLNLHSQTTRMLQTSHLNPKTTNSKFWDWSISNQHIYKPLLVQYLTIEDTPAIKQHNIYLKYLILGVYFWNNYIMKDFPNKSLQII